MRHHLLAVFHPAVVLQVAHGGAVQRFQIDGPGAIGRGLGIHQELELAARQNVEELPVILAGLQFLAVHRQNVIAGRELDVVVIGRAFAVDVGHLVEAGRVGLHFEAGIARLDALLRRTLRGKPAAAGNAGVRGVHIADHLHDQVVQFLAIGDVRQHGLVLVLGRGPVHAVHFGIVEAVLHHAPGFFEDLLALRRDIDFHAHREWDAARRGCRGCPGGRRGGGSRRRRRVRLDRPPRPPPARQVPCRPPTLARLQPGCKFRRPAGSRCRGCRGPIGAR